MMEVERIVGAIAANIVSKKKKEAKGKVPEYIELSFITIFLNPQYEQSPIKPSATVLLPNDRENPRSPHVKAAVQKTSILDPTMVSTFFYFLGLRKRVRFPSPSALLVFLIL